MIKNAAILFLLLSVSSCATQNNIENVTEIEIIKNANAFMDSWHQAASDANFENYFGKMDTQSVFIGTDASENWTKQQFEAYSKPHFDKGDAWDFKTLERNIYINESKTLIWFDELLDTWMGVCRGSGVIDFDNAEFKIEHYVLSLTIPNDDIQAVIDAKSKNNRIALEQLRSALVQ